MKRCQPIDKAEGKAVRTTASGWLLVSNGNVLSVAAFYANAAISF